MSNKAIKVKNKTILSMIKDGWNYFELIEFFQESREIEREIVKKKLLKEALF